MRTLLKRVIADSSGQHSVEVMLLIAGLVIALAASLHSILPYLAKGFNGMVEALLGPVP